MAEIISVTGITPDGRKIDSDDKDFRIDDFASIEVMERVSMSEAIDRGFVASPIIKPYMFKCQSCGKPCCSFWKRLSNDNTHYCLDGSDSHCHGFCGEST